MPLLKRDSTRPVDSSMMPRIPSLGIFVRTAPRNWPERFRLSLISHGSGLHRQVSQAFDVPRCFSRHTTPRLSLHRPCLLKRQQGQSQLMIRTDDSHAAGLGTMTLSSIVILKGNGALLPVAPLFFDEPMKPFPSYLSLGLARHQ